MCRRNLGVGVGECLLFCVVVCVGGNLLIRAPSVFRPRNTQEHGTGSNRRAGRHNNMGPAWSLDSSRSGDQVRFSSSSGLFKLFWLRGYVVARWDQVGPDHTICQSPPLIGAIGPIISWDLAGHGVMDPP